MRPLLALALLCALGSHPLAVFAASEPVSVSRLSSFGSIVSTHVEQAIGANSVPLGNGLDLAPGVFVTVGPTRLDVFDRTIVPLQEGKVMDPAAAPACLSGCPAFFYDAIQFEWLRLAVESASLSVEIPTLVHIAAHSDIPAMTLLMVAYAAAESRPVLPPRMSLLVNSAGRGLRSQPFYLLTPGGIELQQGSAALGLTIRAVDGEFEVTGADSGLGQSRRAQTLAGLQSILASVKKRNLGKDTAIVVPSDTMSTAELVRLMTSVREYFSRIVLSAGQELRI